MPPRMAYGPVLMGRRCSLSRFRADWAILGGLLVGYWLAFQIVFYSYVRLSKATPVAPDELLRGLAQYIVEPLELAIVAAGAILSIAIYFALVAARKLALWQQYALTALCAIAAAIMFAVIVSFLCTAFGLPWPPLTPRTLAVESLRWIAPFGLWAGISLTLVYIGEVRERERMVALIQKQADAARLQALRYQVNPHFLYNTLNSIATLILDGQNHLAEAMVLRLSHFFRSSLANDPLNDVMLGDEIALQRLYLDLEQIRFPNLSCEFAVPEALASVRVPSLILQPLIENALRHGINADGSPTCLSIVARCDDPGSIVIEVMDDGPGVSDARGMGVGLDNVAGRLAARYGNAATFAAGPRAGGGFGVTLTIPVTDHG